MKYENNTVTSIKIAYIGGGSRGWAWGLMSDLRLAETFERNPALIEATDKQYGKGVTLYIAEAIRAHYGVENRA